jgi:radical SAM superfamily enzyme YgiQ (UPF0313 family)
MHVLFIYPNTFSGYFDIPGFHSGIAQISSVLKDNGHKTSLIVANSEISRRDISKLFLKIKPDIVAFSSTTHQYSYVKQYARFIKEFSDIPVICGGIHATLCPYEVLSCKHIDIACIGEGEYPMLDLANCLEIGKDIDKIPNLWVKDEDKYIKNPLRPLISNLDELPFPDRDLFDYKQILRKSKGIASFIAGRGCPFNCSYCCNHVIRRIYKGKGTYVRIRSVENFLDEISFVTQKYGNLVKTLNFDDDTFTIFHKWVKEFCEKYPKEFDYPFRCNIRVDTVNPKILSMLKNAGCELIRLGIESGNEWLRKNILKRSITNEQIIRVCKFAHKLGLEVQTFNIIGFPFETKSMIEETLEINRLIAPEYIGCSVFYPYPNTELWNLCKKEQLLTSRYKKSYLEEGTTLNLPNLTQKDIKRYQIEFKELSEDSFLKAHYPNIYYIYKLLRNLLGTKITSKFYDRLSNDSSFNIIFHSIMGLKKQTKCSEVCKTFF